MAEDYRDRIVRLIRQLPFDIEEDWAAYRQVCPQAGHVRMLDRM